ncbi:MAG: AAA family ATPase [Oligoflexales bacterium]|nr:AAA family ATPase [Oligoflexales bacterium]
MKKKTQKKVPKAPKVKKNPLPKSLALKHVFSPCKSTQFSFRSTKELKENYEIISQDRAVRAIDMGLGIRKPGYNIYVAGYQGTGKTSVIKTFLEKWSKDAPVPDDWVYVYDFHRNETPKAISLPSGQGAGFRKAMEQAVKRLKQEIPSVLQSEEYENAVNSRISRNNDKQSRQFGELEKIAKKMNFQIKSTRMGIETIPVVDGRALTEKEYAKLSEDERNHIEDVRAELEPQVLEFARKVRHLEVDAKDYVVKLQKDFVNEVLKDVISEVSSGYGSIKEIQTYLKQIHEHVLENIQDFIEDEMGDDEYAPAPTVADSKDRYRKYRVNLFVDNRHQEGAPVVIESNPSYYTLFGKVEKNIDHGMFYTDFTMIKGGAIHKANGGYLVLEASDVFKLPSVWDTLKRVLRNRLGFIEDMGEQVSMFPTSGIRPEPIPLDVKVILIGSDDIYHLLYDLDEEFSKIFKIKADFDYKMPRNKANTNAYVSFVSTRCHKEGLLHFDKSGVAAIIEYSSRLVEDQGQLTTQFGEIKDLTIEADYIAREQNKRYISRAHVEQALKEKFYRVNLIEEHLMESIERQDIVIAVDGTCIGQVNGLAVYEMGDYTFGKPGRITCVVAANDDGIINVERSSKLSGNIHDKGVLILTGFLNALLAKKYALGYSASVCFEQSYGMIDGDSATIAELIAIISAMAEVPVDLSFSITGSLNQLGEVQPVGGINEKIEGFYKCCQVIGKEGSYKVIIPHQNISNLMLQSDCREAVESGELSIYPVRYFWEAFELVTGVPLGAKSVQDAEFTPGSALEMIKKKLDDLHEEENKEDEKSKDSKS